MLIRNKYFQQNILNTIHVYAQVSWHKNDEESRDVLYMETVWYHIITTYAEHRHVSS